MKSGNSGRHIKYLQLLTVLLRNPDSLRIGYAQEGEGGKLVVIQISKDGKTIPVAWGTGVPFILRLLLPMAVSADLGMVPVHCVAAEPGDEDPDAWIDRNEEQLIPAGFTADQITTESHFENGRLLSMSVVTGSRDAALAGIETANLQVAALFPPLAGLAHLYRNLRETPFILWYISENGSVLGRISRGNVEKLCHYWADNEALQEDPQGITADAAELAASLQEHHTQSKWFIFSTTPLPAGFSAENTGSPFIPAPTLNTTLPVSFYAAFGNAGIGESGLNLLPFHLRQKRAALKRTFTAAIGVFRTIFLILAMGGVAGGSYIGISRLLQLRDRAAMKSIDIQYEALKRAEEERDSLRTLFKQQAGFIGSESSLTRLLDDLQEVFPEGVKAEEFTVAETGAAAWKLSIRAFSVSSGLMQPAVVNLRKVKGCSDVRVVYSEQAAGQRNTGGIRFKIEAVWR